METVTTYEQIRLKHMQSMQALIPEHVRRTRWPLERVAQEQEECLRRLLAVAVERSPWHRERLRGIDAATFRVSDLAHVPPMTKDDLVANFEEIVTDRRLTNEVVEKHIEKLDRDHYLLDEYHAAITGGSSGKRGIAVYDWDSWIAFFLGLFRYIFADPRVTEKKSDGPVKVAHVTGTTAAYGTVAIRSTFNMSAFPAIEVDARRPIGQVVAELNEIQPGVLFTYSSLLRLLAHEQQEGRLKLDLGMVVSFAEPLTRQNRDAITKVWPEAILHNWYAATETGALAASCGHGPFMHLDADLAIVEPVDKDGRPVPPGVRSDRVYVTPLTNRLLPLIRYEVNDELTLLPDDTPPCPCGSKLPRIADVEGRNEELLVYPNGSFVHWTTVLEPLSADLGVVGYQVRQTPRGVHVLVHGPSPNVGQLETSLAAALRRRGLADPEVSVEVVDAIPRMETSVKHRRLIPLAPGSF
jgi:phenylacetate-CoA ligase